MSISRRVSIKDIAKAAGVSYSTVSRALNDSDLISGEVRERIHRLAQEMGYSPNALAQSLHSIRSHSIGVIITTVSDPFFAEVVQGVEETAKESGVSVFLATSNNDAAQELQIIETLSRRRVDGVILAASRIGKDYAAQLEEVRIPVIMINNQAEGEYENLYTIAVDDRTGGKMATQHLIDLGHRRIGYIGVKNRPGSNERRLQGFLQTLKENDIIPRPEWVRMNEGTIPEGLLGDMRAGQEQAFKLIDAGVSAIFCYCDSVAAGALAACRETNIDVPEQISIIGFDDSELCTLLCPPLTTISQPMQQMGQMAMRMLLAVLSGGLVEDQILEPELVIRESTAKCKE